MRTFLLKVILALLIVAGFHLVAGLWADGRTDDYYLRFATPKARSLVLGGSRAAQGIHPDVFNTEALQHAFEGPLFNFGFTIAHSPYGPTYYKAIEHKLDTTARNGLFILCVDPWVLTAHRDKANDADRFKEKDRLLGTQWTFAMRPNYEYLVRHYGQGWGALSCWPKGDPDTTATLLADGRLELHIPMDSATVAARTARKVQHYRTRMMQDRVWSEVRFDWLLWTVERLRPHGRVVLVRLPATKAILELEHVLAPEFNDRMNALAGRMGASFMDLSTLADSVCYTDGNHLDGPSGRRMSELLAKRLLGTGSPAGN
ncbi:MAG: hypothetical protein JNM31_14375 [Flavobacteriales bacterium]|nr:hypothetical protein [Flavobacteriales bacterium]